MVNYIIPILILALIVYAVIKKVKCYDSFVLGAKQTLPLVFSLFPYICAVYLMIYLMRAAGLAAYLTQFLSPVFNFLGVPGELAEIIILRPFSGSGSLALLENIYRQYGTEGYVARCASVIMGSTETVFYVAGVYFANIKAKGIGKVMFIALVCSFLGCILACALCRVM